MERGGSVLRHDIPHPRGNDRTARQAASFIGQAIPIKTVELVLVCDDDATYRHVNRTAFEQEGAAVAEAVDGADCLDRARACKPT